MKRFHTNLQSVEGHRLETFEGKEYNVFPTVLIKEGVLNGLFYPAEEIAKFPSAWNGRPVPVFHPENDEGVKISCNDPAVIEQWTIGYLFNVAYDEETLALKGEVWLETEKANQLSPGLIDNLLTGAQVDVSTGLWGDEITQPGIHDGAQYEAVMTNFRPDHLALLPGGEGACSWADGCGIRVNENEREKAIRVKYGMMANEKNLTDLHQKVVDYVNGLDETTQQGDFKKIHFLEEVFDKYFVYRAKDNSANPPTTKLLKQSYTFNNGELEISTDLPQEVIEKKKYVPVGNEESTTNNEQEIIMKKEEMVKAIIGSELTAFNADDEEMLTNMDEKFLEKLVPKAPETNEEDPPDGDNAPAVNEDGDNAPAVNEEDEPPTGMEFLANATDEQRESIDMGLQLLRQKKAACVKALLANEGNKFAKDELVSMKINMLEKMVSLLPVKEEETTRGGDAFRLNNLDDLLGNTGDNSDPVPAMPLIVPSK